MKFLSKFQEILKIKSKPVLFLLTMHCLYFLYFPLFFVFFSSCNRNFFHKNNYLFTSLLGCIVLFYPAIGWITDTFVGRYKTIIFGNIVCLFPIFSASVMYLLLKLTTSTTIAVIFGYLTIILISVGWGSVTANMIQFMTDQIYSSPADELSAAIYWYGWIGYTSFFAVNILHCYMSDFLPAYAYLIGAFACVVISLTAHYIYHRGIDTTPQIKNTVKTIFQVLNYARKHKYPENRCSNTYIDELHPSRLDLGKEAYGGPFSEGDVEDVKTVLRLLPLLACMLVTGLWAESRITILFHLVKSPSVKACTLAYIPQYVPGVIGVPLYQLIIVPCCYKYIPRMLRRIAFGIIILLCGSLVYLAIDGIGHWLNEDAICMFNTTAFNTSDILPIDIHWVIIPQALNGIGYIILLNTGTEFVVAQSPHLMKGLLIGIHFAMITAGYVIGGTIFYFFTLIPSAIPSCGFYYYLTKVVLITVILVAFMCIARWYKLRNRETVVNLNHIIAEHHYKFIMQRQDTSYESFECSTLSRLSSSTVDIIN